MSVSSIAAPSVSMLRSPCGHFKFLEEHGQVDVRAVNTDHVLAAGIAGRQGVADACGTELADRVDINIVDTIASQRVLCNEFASDEGLAERLDEFVVEIIGCSVSSHTYTEH